MFNFARKSALFTLSVDVLLSSASTIPLTTPIVVSDCSSRSGQVNHNGSEIWPWQSYKSFNATPPNLQINTTGKALSPGLLFFGQENAAPVSGVKEEAAYIMSDTDDLVWRGPLGQTSNFGVQTLDNNPVITYWKGNGAAASSTQAGNGYGAVSILDTTYTKIHTVCPKLELTIPPGLSDTASCVADVHESYITPRNTMLITVYNITMADLSAIKDPATGLSGPVDGWVYDPLAVEVNITTGDILFLWSPLAHVPINQSHIPLSGTGTNTSAPYDWFHTNSIQSFRGNYLINSPFLWTTYLVNKEGAILWEINGETGGDFGSLPENGHFSFQHYARLSALDAEDPSHVLLRYHANNNGAPNSTVPTLGLALNLTLPPSSSHPPSVLTNLSDPINPVFSFAEGSYDQLPNGDYFMGYGIRPIMKEFGNQSSTGSDTLWSAQFGFNNNINGAQSYRTYKKEWHATPAGTKPDLVVGKASTGDELTACASGSRLRGYVSWNGATDVTAWIVYAGTLGTNLEQLYAVANRGFETEFVIPAGVSYVQVGAVETLESGVVRKSDIISIY